MKEAGASLAFEALVPITDAAIQFSIVDIGDALAQQIGLRLPGNDKVKEAGALLAFEKRRGKNDLCFVQIETTIKKT